MKVFLTSAAGYVGAEIAKLLLADGHVVFGLARSDARCEELRRHNVTPVRGSLEDLAALAQAAKEADAVIHTAFVHTGESYEEACVLDRKAIAAMTDALAGSGKAFINSSGTGFLGETGALPVSEEFPVDYRQPVVCRTLSERATLLALNKGVKAMVLRLPPYVWGNGGSTFIPVQLAAARKCGVSYYVLPGTQQVSAAHVQDLAHLYILALQKGTAGAIYHAVTSSNTTNKALAEAVAENAGATVKGVALEEAYKLGVWPGWIVELISTNSRASSAKAERELGWGGFKEVTMLEDIARGSYVLKA